MKKTISLKEWIRRINEEEMPVFAHTARQIAAASKGIDTPVAELAHLVLQDSSMTARVLRLANSAYYNPAGRPVSTISRAILMLGFDTVRSIALTIAIIDPLLKGLQHDHVIQEMARAFHAAVQAKAIAEARGITNIEEVFIAALLYRLGHMAFWCFPFGHAKTLDSAYQQWEDLDQAEIEVLGFALRELTRGLNAEWHLSDLLARMLSDQGSSDEARDLHDAYQLVLAVEEGWGSIATKRAINTIAERVALSLDETIAMIHRSTREAVQVTREYGIEVAGKHIPLPSLGKDALPEQEQDKASAQLSLQLQMNILRELTTMLHEKVDLNAVVSTVLEGVYRALDMERTIIAFVATEDNRLKAKYLLGDEKGRLKRCFDFPVNEQGNDFFSYILRQKDGVWLNNKTRLQLEPLLSTDIRQCLGMLEFFVMPIRIAAKGKGVVYADRKLTGRPLTEQDFQTFVHFAEHISIACELMTRQK